jgi:hypothetical protein
MPLAKASAANRAAGKRWVDVAIMALLLVGKRGGPTDGPSITANEVFAYFVA